MTRDKSGHTGTRLLLLVLLLTHSRVPIWEIGAANTARQFRNQ